MAKWVIITPANFIIKQIFYSIAEAIIYSDSSIFSDEILEKFNFKDEAKFKTIFEKQRAILEKQKDIDFNLSVVRHYLSVLENDLSVDYERLLELERYKDELENQVKKY